MDLITFIQKYLSEKNLSEHELLSNYYKYLTSEQSDGLLRTTPQDLETFIEKMYTLDYPLAAQMISNTFNFDDRKLRVKYLTSKLEAESKPNSILLNEISEIHAKFWQKHQMKSQLIFSEKYAIKSIYSARMDLLKAIPYGT